jgi:hypothetical protein
MVDSLGLASVTCEQVLNYVGRYTHRVAISNNRLLDIVEGKVLPGGFQRICCYGFLANRYREQTLARCRELLGMAVPEPAPSEASTVYRDRYEELTDSSL